MRVVREIGGMMVTMIMSVIDVLGLSPLLGSLGTLKKSGTLGLLG